MADRYDVAILGGDLVRRAHRRTQAAAVGLAADVVHAFPTYAEALEPAYADLARRLPGEDR